MSYSLTFMADMGSANTGLTLRAQLYDSDGSANGAEITTGFVEVDATNAPGVYAYRHTSLPDDHDGIFAIYNNADKTQRVAFSVNPSEVEYGDAKTSAIMTTQMTEAYAADGVAPTPAQALFLIQQMLTEFAISSVTLTAKKLDGSTSAATFTLDDATNPTSITRTT